MLTCCLPETRLIIMDISEPSKAKGFNFRKVPHEEPSQYTRAGGVLDEGDYRKVLELAKSKGIGALPQPGKSGGKAADLVGLKGSAREMVQGTGITLRDDWDIRTLVYLMLSTDETLRAKYAHKLEKREQILAETFRIVGDTDSFDKIKGKYSSISFFDRN